MWRLDVCPPNLNPQTLLTYSNPSPNDLRPPKLGSAFGRWRLQGEFKGPAHATLLNPEGDTFYFAAYRKLQQKQELVLHSFDVATGVCRWGEKRKNAALMNRVKWYTNRARQFRKSRSCNHKLFCSLSRK